MPPVHFRLLQAKEICGASARKAIHRHLVIHLERLVYPRIVRQVFDVIIRPHEGAALAPDDC